MKLMVCGSTQIDGPCGLEFSTIRPFTSCLEALPTYHLNEFEITQLINKEVTLGVFVEKEPVKGVDRDGYILEEVGDTFTYGKVPMAFRSFGYGTQWSKFIKDSTLLGSLLGFTREVFPLIMFLFILYMLYFTNPVG
ncbi:hypothetical protein ACH5RR_023557 [Cinchona calisaya]|uniref:Uncharacterized protein n=1 Tax=Cinchona calisaya TaxID=153742 RepID=A0ABD2ZEB4_9GENT